MQNEWPSRSWMLLLSARSTLDTCAETCDDTVKSDTGTSIRKAITLHDGRIHRE